MKKHLLFSLLMLVSGVHSTVATSPTEVSAEDTSLWQRTKKKAHAAWQHFRKRIGGNKWKRNAGIAGASAATLALLYFLMRARTGRTAPAQEPAPAPTTFIIRKRPPAHLDVTPDINTLPDGAPVKSHRDGSTGRMTDQHMFTEGRIKTPYRIIEGDDGPRYWTTFKERRIGTATHPLDTPVDYSSLACIRKLPDQAPLLFHGAYYLRWRDHDQQGEGPAVMDADGEYKFLGQISPYSIVEEYTDDDNDGILIQ